MPAFDLDSFLPYKLDVVATQVSRRLSERYAGASGLSMPEWRVVAHLSRAGMVSVRDIAARANLHKSLASRATDRLHAAGLVTKTQDKTDRRLVALRLTRKGEALMRQIEIVAGAFQSELAQALGADAAAFERGLGALRALTQDAETDAAMW